MTDRRGKADGTIRDHGAALITVIVLGAVMMVLITTGMTVAVSGLRQATSTQNMTSASDAAFAGVQDYLARVSTDPTYVDRGNPASAFSAATGSAVTLPTGSAANPAFNVLAGGAGAADRTSWAAVAGSGGLATFRYEVDNSTYAASGIIRLQVTGAAKDRTRTLLATIRVRGFVDYSYFTDYEIRDPQLSGAPATCGTKHAWEGRAANCGGVADIRFGAGDALSGDVHSNDTMIICGSTFTGTITTANTRTPLYTTPGGCTNSGIRISRATSLPMPSTNSAMREDAACVYTGPTRIVYNGDGTMTVVSPWTRYTKVSGSTGTAPAACGDPAALASPAGATVPQLNNDLLFVQSVPPLAGDPNHWAATAVPAGVKCLDANAQPSTSGTGAGWSLADSGGTVRVRFPAEGESPATGWQNTGNVAQWATTTPAYGCRSGDLYVQGTVTGLTTAASENYVYVIGDVLYQDREADVLGLVGQNAVLVWNPMNAADSPMLNDAGRYIDAAIVSVAHTFLVQNYDRGATRGALNIFGSIAQKFRGPVATSGDRPTGYTKSYSYNPLLKTVSPPKFLAPSATSFAVIRYASVPIAFDATGAAR